MFNRTNFLMWFLLFFSVIAVLCMKIKCQEYFGISNPECSPIFVLSLILAFMFEGSRRQTLYFTDNINK